MRTEFHLPRIHDLVLDGVAFVWPGEEFEGFVNLVGLVGFAEVEVDAIGPDVLRVVYVTITLGRRGGRVGQEERGEEEG